MAMSSASSTAKRFVVVSTQGKGDEAALRAAVATKAAYHAFVGSRRKMAALRKKLIAEGVTPQRSINQGAGRARSRRHHAGRDRDVDPGRDHRRTTARPARRQSPKGVRTDHADERQPAHPGVTEKVWAALNDPAVLKQCIPGCQSLDVTAPNEMTATVSSRSAR